MLTPFGELPASWVEHASRSELHDLVRVRASRRSFLKGAALAGLGVASPALWTQSARAAEAGPAVVSHVGVGVDPRTEATVSFASAGPFRTALVEYGPTGAFGGSAAVDVRSVAGVDTRYGHAVLSGLAPGTTYRYRVRLDGVVMPGATLTTAPGSAQPFSFTAFGDEGVSPSAAAIVGQIRRLDPAFHLLAGDLCYADSSGQGRHTDRFDPTVWDAWLRQVEPVASRTAWMCATGNHDMEPGYGPQGYDGYLGRFVVPGNGAPGCPTTYAFRYGNVGVVSLDANDVSYEITHNTGYSDGRQSAWLDRQLAAYRDAGSGVDFIVVVFHHCAYSTSTSHGSDGGVRRHWVPIFDRHRVDLVVNGHAHLYERTAPLRGGVVTGPAPVGGRVDASSGTTYVTAGGGGRRRDGGGFVRVGSTVTQLDRTRTPEPAEWTLPSRSTEHCFLHVSVTPAAPPLPATMTVRAVGLHGQLLDSVTLVAPPRADAPPRGWLVESAVGVTGAALALRQVRHRPAPGHDT